MVNRASCVRALVILTLTPSGQVRPRGASGICSSARSGNWDRVSRRRRDDTADEFPIVGWSSRAYLEVDTLVPSSSREKLLAAVVPLEAVPDSEKDWHPSSGGLVLDLIHPYLYPIVYGRTVGKGSDSTAAPILVAQKIADGDPGFAELQLEVQARQQCGDSSLIATWVSGGDLQKGHGHRAVG